MPPGPVTRWVERALNTSPTLVQFDGLFRSQLVQFISATRIEVSLDPLLCPHAAMKWPRPSWTTPAIQRPFESSSAPLTQTPRGLPSRASMVTTRPSASSMIDCVWLGRRGASHAKLGYDGHTLWPDPTNVSSPHVTPSSPEVQLIRLSVSGRSSPQPSWTSFCCSVSTVTSPNGLTITCELGLNTLFESGIWQWGKKCSCVHACPPRGIWQ